MKIGDQYFRMRRGKLVQISEKWLGVTTTPRVLRKRQSKKTRKSRMVANVEWHDHGRMDRERKRQLKALGIPERTYSAGHPRNVSIRHAPSIERKLQRELRRELEDPS